MAQTFGAEIAPIGPLDPGGPKPDDEAILAEGMKQEFGFKPVRALAPHPLLAGLGEKPVFFEAHYWEGQISAGRISALR